MATQAEISTGALFDCLDFGLKDCPLFEECDVSALQPGVDWDVRNVTINGQTFQIYITHIATVA